MVENTAMSFHNVNTEIDRYIIWPGQVCHISWNCLVNNLSVHLRYTEGLKLKLVLPLESSTF